MAQLKDTLITGDARVTGNIYGTLKGNADTVNNHTVSKDVPSDAKFTDTIYTHPATHPASMISGLQTVATSGNYNDLSNTIIFNTEYNATNNKAATMTDINNAIFVASNNILY